MNSSAAAALPIYVNGRYLSQPLTGVQRVAYELTASLAKIYGSRLTILAPCDAVKDAQKIRVVGTRRGQLWEQLELPLFAHDGILLNFGNIAPLVQRRQIVMIHDAGVFANPEAYSKKFRAWYGSAHKILSLRRVPILTVSSFSRSELLKYLPVRKDAIYLVGPGLDHMKELFADNSILEKNRLCEKGFVLAVGTLAYHKNLASLDALSHMLTERGMQLVVVGTDGGSAFSVMKNQNLLPMALHLGRVPDAALKALYSHAACFVMPSFYEGYGLPAIEAMVNDCPVVAADIPALRETCGDAALYCDPRNQTAIAGAVARILASAEESQRLINAGRRIVDSLAWRRSGETVRSVINHLWPDQAESSGESSSRLQGV